jgi:acetyl-CoA synthetase
MSRSHVAGTWATIPRRPGHSWNLPDYERARREFTWAGARSQLTGLPGGEGINIAHEAVDRHVLAGKGERPALRCVAADGRVHEVTYAELMAESNRFANLLRTLDVAAGERVFSLLGRSPELYVALLGTLKNTCVFSPLFADFGPEPIRERMRLGSARVLVTSSSVYREKVAPIRDQLPTLQHVLIVDAAERSEAIDLTMALAGQSEHFRIPPTDPETTALLHFTSGTTGRPKGALHVHGAVIAHHATSAIALDLSEGDVFWCTADPGWVTGTSYGVIAPLTHAATVVVDGGELDARHWYTVLESAAVDVWYTAPTGIRLLMRYGSDLADEFDLRSLRHIASVGEALNPEAVEWSHETFGIPVHDSWWQTETGAIMISNLPSMDIRPGSMGRPMPGVEARVLVRGEDGRARTSPSVREAPPDTVGELALRAGWPSMFRGYLDEPERYAACFADGWYLTGDLACMDHDGYVWFVGRADDVITSAGHLIGPFEVESVLMEHPAVAEAGVIGRPDPVAGEVVKAFVTLKEGYRASENLHLELIGFGRRRLGGFAPREIAFDQHLPHTGSGKVMRRLLKARDQGLPEGDVSTLSGTVTRSTRPRRAR